MNKFLLLSYFQSKNIHSLRVIALVALIFVSVEPISAQTNKYWSTIESNILQMKKYSGDYLRSIHPTGLLKALTIADGSFAILNPQDKDGQAAFNRDAQLKSSKIGSLISSIEITDKNPLILVDGYEISRQRLVDFDLSRVNEVITITDAAALSVFGTRGANGVIYIKTKRPVDTNLNVSYQFNARFGFADLSSFNLMSVAEKLKVEKEAGFYNDNQPLYDERAKSKNSSNYWLKLPIKSSFYNTHNIDVEGSESKMNYRLSIMAEPEGRGAFIGEKSDRYGAGAQLEYRSGRLSIANDIRLDVASGERQPTINLGMFSLVNPYFEPYNAAGFLYERLGEETFNTMFSPLHEANINSFHKSSYKNVSDNLSVTFEICNNLKAVGTLSYSKDFQKFNSFVSHLSYIYADVTVEQIPNRGKYSIRRNDFTTVESSAGLSYSKKLKNNNFDINALFSSSNMKIYEDNYEAIGFPNTSMSYISFAKQYAFNSTPGGKEIYNRLFGGTLFAAWNYDNRFTVNASLRTEKSSMLSADNNVATFYGVAAGWNLHNEKWLKDSKLINKLTVRASLGTTGGVDFGYDAKNLYGYYFENPYLDYPNGSSSVGLPSLSLILRGNGNLKWRTLSTQTLMLDFDIFNRISVRAFAYSSFNNDMLAFEETPLVEGREKKLVNQGGVETKGIDFSINGKILKSERGDLNIFIKGHSYKNSVKGFSSYWESMSVKNGTSTGAIYIDNVEVGNMTPTMSGIFGLNGKMGSFGGSIIMGYSFGGDFYNEIAVSRIVNGDIKYNMPANGCEKPLVDYVESSSYLSLQSVNINYTLPSDITKKLAMNNIFVGITCNDLFYSNKNRIERGYITPFTRSFTLTLKGNF